MAIESLLGSFFEVFQSLLMEAILSFFTGLLGQFFPFFQ